MKKKIFLLLIISVMLFSACGTKKEENKEKNEEKGNSNVIIESKKSAYVSTLNAYSFAARNEMNMGKYGIYDSSTLYLIPAANKCIQTETGGSSPFSKEWKYVFIGVTYSGSSYDYYTLALGGSNMGTNLVSFQNLDSSSIQELSEVGSYTELYNLTSDKTYNKNEMNSDLLNLISGLPNISKIKVLTCK